MTTTDDRLRELAKQALFADGFDAMQYPNLVESTFQALQQVRRETVEKCAKVAEDCQNCFEPEECACGRDISEALRKLNGEGGRP